MMHDLLPLNFLTPGHTAEVVQIVGSPEQVMRVQEMGILQGARVQMMQGGSPCIVRIQGQTLCIRATEILRVLVRPQTQVHVGVPA